MMLFLLILTIMSSLECSNDCYFTEKTSHHLSAVSIQEIVNLRKLLRTRSNLKEIFSKINVVRPVGSVSHSGVRKFITEYLSLLKWNVEETPFSMSTIIGPKDFVNIIGTQNITKSRRLVLACHYDSLRMDNFFGSIDSAMSCAMMLSLAEVLTPLLVRSNIDVSLELIFFDGEEAFEQWSATDSLYGSRYLAKLWENVKDPLQCSKLKTIDSLVLLDLLGANNPKFYYFSNGNYRLYESLRRIESTIEQQEDIFSDAHHPYFSKHTIDSMVQDDHVPFLERDVPIVHLIPVPFPPQWHKLIDNINGVSWEVSSDLELIFSVLLVQYFHLGNVLSIVQNDELY